MCFKHVTPPSTDIADSPHSILVGITRRVECGRITSLQLMPSSSSSTPVTGGILPFVDVKCANPHLRARFDESKRELESLLTDEQLSNCPVLILGNKIDRYQLPNAPD